MRPQGGGKTLFLQFNQRGAWTRGVEFDAGELERVEQGAIALLRAISAQVDARIVADQSKSPKVIGWLNHGAANWRKR